jgi:UDPglucose 6-dehydrogenase
MITRIAVVGLGKLGWPLVKVLAARGFPVVGHDVLPSRLDALRAEMAREPALAARVELTDDLARVRETDVSFVAVPTPSSRDGGYSLRHVERCFRGLGAALASARGDGADSEPRYHVVALLSTVLPGDVRELAKVLEKAAGRPLGPRLGLCYNPAFIALGRVEHDFLHPDFVLVGESDPRAGDVVAAVHARLTDAPVRRMSFENAELCKIAVNAFVTMKISFGNALARICERLPGGDVDQVTGALGLDRRVGERYLSGGLGYGGPCFPRDNRAFVRMARQRGLTAHAAVATDRVNRDQTDFLSELVLSRAPRGKTVAILGVSYKPDTDVIEASQGIALAEALLAKGRRVVLADPMALESARAVFGRRVRYAASGEAAVVAADVVVITTAWPLFAELADDALAGDGKRRVLIDCWRQLTRRRLPPLVDYVPLGRGPITKGASAPKPRLKLITTGATPPNPRPRLIRKAR